MEDNDVANLRKQKLDNQLHLLKKKQRQRRQEPLMVMPNPNAKSKPRHQKKHDDQAPLVESCSSASLIQGTSNPVPIEEDEEDILVMDISTISIKDSIDANVDRTKKSGHLPDSAPVYLEPIKSKTESDQPPQKGMTERKSTSNSSRTSSKRKDKSRRKGSAVLEDEDQEFLQKEKLPEDEVQPFDFSSEEEGDVMKVEDFTSPQTPVKRRTKKKPPLKNKTKKNLSEDENMESDEDESEPKNSHLTSPDSSDGEESIESDCSWIEFDDPTEFAFRIAPEGVTVNCRIVRDKKGIDGGIFPTYYLYLEKTNGSKVFLMAGRKRKRSTTSNYLISTDSRDLSRNGGGYIGKVRSNALGTRFTVYDNGVNPAKRPFVPETIDIRQELVALCYETNVLGFRGPRKMTVILPSIDEDNQMMSIRPRNEHETLLMRYQNSNLQNISILHTKNPVWNPATNSFILNFHGRVTQSSVKNFQIVRFKKKECLVMQFGRVADDVFTMDYSHPLCAVQAFAIALSGFDNKLACE